MKMKYEEIQVSLVMLSVQDVLTTSGFEGEMDEFDTPNNSTNNVTFG